MISDEGVQQVILYENLGKNRRLKIRCWGERSHKLCEFVIAVINVLTAKAEFSFLYPHTTWFICEVFEETQMSFFYADTWIE